MTDTLLVGSVVVLGVLLGLHGLDVYLARRDKAAREAKRQRDRAALLAAMGAGGRAPAAPGTMRRRYSDPQDTPEDGDEGGVPTWRQEW